LKTGILLLLTHALLTSVTYGATDAKASTTALDRYLEGLKTLRVSFTQSIQDARGRQTDQAKGSLVVSRPGKFRWETQPQGQSSASQLLIADGRNLWFYDQDLEQVTVKPMDAALSATPAMLLSGGADVRSQFNISAADPSNGLEWVRVTPRGAEADFREALLGFGGGELRRMILKDKLGQTATLEFDKTQRNAPVPPEEVSFTPPPGTDVIGTPSK
jgi:chaperone LolA